MENYTEENLKSLFNNHDLSKENLIKKLNEICEIYSFNIEYINNIQNIALDDYLAKTNRPLKNYPDKPDFNPIHGDNFPSFFGDTMKPKKVRTSFFEFDWGLYALFILGLIFIEFFCRNNNDQISGFALMLLWWLFLHLIFYLFNSYKNQKKYKEELEKFDKTNEKEFDDYNKRKADYEKNLKLYKAYEKEKDEVDKYNIALLSNKEYKNEYELYLKTQKEIYNLYQNPEIVALMKSFLHEEYWEYCKDISKIIETGRADSLKEALNILVNDLNSKKLFEEQQRKNDILSEDLKKQREIQEQAYNDQLKYYNAQLEIEMFRTNEAIRHNNAIERSAENNTKAVALCASCPIVNRCTHVGKKTSHCRSVKRYN